MSITTSPSQASDMPRSRPSDHDHKASIQQVSLAQFEPLLDHLRGIVGYFDLEHRCIYANHAYAKAFHTTPEQMLGRPIREIVGESAWRFIEPYAKRVLAGESVRYVREVNAGEADSQWMEVHLVPSASQDGKIMGNFVFIDDVTQQHMAQQAVRESEERTQRFIEAGTEGIVFYRDGVIFDCNDAFEKILGKHRDELIGLPASHLFQKHDRPMAEKHMHLGRETSYPAQLPHADGSLVTVEITGRDVIVNGQAASVAVVRDNTQLASINEALLRSQARYRSLVDNSDQCAFFTQDRKILYANPAAQKLFGPHADGLHGLESLFLIHPDDRAYALMRRKQLIAGDLNTEVMVRSISPPSENIQENTRITWVRLHGSIIEWEGSIGVLIFLTDITALRESEEKMRKALAQEKELGDLKTRFVSMASHEFRTPLATIQTSSELLEHYNERMSQAERAEAVMDIQRAVSRMQAMMDRFLAFGRMDAGTTAFSPRPVKLLSYLQALLQEASPAQSRRHTITLEIAASLNPEAMLMLDDVLLGQIVINLTTNACKYSREGTTILIHVDQEKRAEAVFLSISVRDQGVGIPEAELPLLFASFYRASNAGNVPGTGLGLAIVDRAARAHGGGVQVTSQLGQGSEFKLTLPWIDAVT
jgi:PAS domain S-box-containing protein